MNLQDLKYVCDHAGNGLLPVLAFIHVDPTADGNRAQVGNGRYTVDVPTDLPLCTVDAGRLVAAWAACKSDDVSATCTDANLMIKAGRIKARIPLSDPKAYPVVVPDERTAHTAPGVAAILAKLQPFVATDASRPWATSVCLTNGFAYATNNVVLVRAPFPVDLPAVNLPLSVFDAIIARGEPEDLGFTDNSLTLYFDNGVWIKTNLISGSWPTATVDGLIAALPDAWETPHPELGMVLATAAKVSEAKHPVVQFASTVVKLTDDAFEADELGPLPDAGKVNARMAALVFERATDVQWHSPKQDVHAFKVDEIIGVFGGQR
jgi:hypothetical protein